MAVFRAHDIDPGYQLRGGGLRFRHDVDESFEAILEQSTNFRACLIGGYGRERVDGVMPIASDCQNN